MSEKGAREPGEGLSPEQQEQVEEVLARARAALGGVSRAGLLASILRGVGRSVIPRPRFRPRKLVVLGVGVLVAVLSVATCSAGVDLTTLTAQYGAPVPATKEAAQRFVERAGAAISRAPANRRFRITISEAEATSALSLGLMIPELTRAMETLPPEEFERTDDIEELRALLRERESAQRASRTFRERVAAIFDPHLSTGDVQVQFTGDGEIVIAGYVQAWRFKQPALVVFSPRARRGELQLDFVKGRLGRLPAPVGALDVLGRLVSSLILQGREYAEISNLGVAEGRLTFEASVNK